MSRVTNAIVIDAPQRSEKWFGARLGNVTGSKFKEAIRSVGVLDKNAAIRSLLGVKQLNANVKASEEFQELNSLTGLQVFAEAGLDLPDNEKRVKYRQTRVAERLTGMPGDLDQYVSKAMLWGQANERLAIAKYQLITGNKVDPAFLLLHPTLRCGATPDGNVTDRLTGEMGVLEAKCLNSDNHLYKILKTGVVPEDFEAQIQGEMWLANVDYCDFVGYDSRLPGKLDIFVKRVERDDNFIDNVLEPEITAFLAEVDADERFFRMLSRKGFDFNLHKELVTV